MVARLGLGLSLVTAAVLTVAPLQLASKTETATMRVTATVTPSCLVTSPTTTVRYVRVSCPTSTSPFRIYSTAHAVTVAF